MTVCAKRRQFRLYTSKCNHYVRCTIGSENPEQKPFTRSDGFESAKELCACLSVCLSCRDLLFVCTEVCFFNFFLLFSRSEVVTGYLSRVVRKPDFCICENKGADQLRGDREDDQRLCFRYIDSTIPLLPIYEISSL